MAMDTLFGKHTPWGRAVASCDDLSTLIAQGKDQICVTAEIRAEWLLGHKTVVVDGKKRVLEFTDMGGGLWVAKLFVVNPQPTAAAATPAPAPA